MADDSIVPPIARRSKKSERSSDSGVSFFSSMKRTFLLMVSVCFPILSRLLGMFLFVLGIVVVQSIRSKDVTNSFGLQGIRSNIKIVPCSANPVESVARGDIIAILGCEVSSSNLYLQFTGRALRESTLGSQFWSHISDSFAVSWQEGIWSTAKQKWLLASKTRRPYTFVSTNSSRSILVGSTPVSNSLFAPVLANTFANVVFNEEFDFVKTDGVQSKRAKDIPKANAVEYTPTYCGKTSKSRLVPDEFCHQVFDSSEQVDSFDWTKLQEYTSNQAKVSSSSCIFTFSSRLTTKAFHWCNGDAFSTAHSSLMSNNLGNLDEKDKNLISVIGLWDGTRVTPFSEAIATPHKLQSSIFRILPYLSDAWISRGNKTIDNLIEAALPKSANPNLEDADLLKLDLPFHEIFYNLHAVNDTTAVHVIGYVLLFCSTLFFIAPEIYDLSISRKVMVWGVRLKVNGALLLLVIAPLTSFGLYSGAALSRTSAGQASTSMLMPDILLIGLSILPLVITSLYCYRQKKAAFEISQQLGWRSF